MTKIDDALVERMVNLVRDLHADHVEHNMHDRVQDFVARTAAIVAELPEPVDPDVAEVDAILNAAEFYWTDRAREVAVSILKRGRELERLSSTGRE